MIIDIPAQIIPESQADKYRDAIRTSAYPTDCKNSLFAFVELMETRDWSQAEAARHIKHGPRKNSLSGPALSQLLTGQYKADPTTLCRAIDRVITLERGRALFAVAGFVETHLYNWISDLADIAVITQRIGVLHGGLLCGKTTAATALAGQYERAASVFMTAPYADSYGGFVRRLATVRNVSLKGTLSDIRERIISSLDGSHLLIIDEFHQPIVSYAHGQAVRVMEFIREINDLSRCGVLLVGSTAGFAILSTHPDYTRLFASVTPVDVVAKTSRLNPNSRLADLAKIAKSFGLEPDPDSLEYCANLADQHTMARLFDSLRLATGRADKRREELSWDHVLKVTESTLKLAA